MIGAPISVIIYLVMMTQLDKEALVTGVIWCVLGLIIYAFCRKRYQSDETKEVNRLIMEEEIPTPQERQKMDKEFKIWRTVVICAVVIAAAAYVIPFIVV